MKEFYKLACGGSIIIFQLLSVQKFIFAWNPQAYQMGGKGYFLSPCQSISSTPGIIIKLFVSY